MMNPKTKPVLFASALFLALALTACASGPSSIPSAELQKRIDTARTPTEHESLSTYYDSEAATARTRAEDHRKMAKAYLSSRNSGTMAAHCDALARAYDGIARDYAEMAVGHRQLASQAKP